MPLKREKVGKVRKMTAEKGVRSKDEKMKK